MSEIKLYREYRLKFYLNARHYIIINGEKGEVHPHTWEFALRIKFGHDGFVQFGTFERGVEEYLAKYQNTVMNENEPFDSVMPTLENIADFFSGEFYRIIKDIGGKLVVIEASETPTRSYILNLEEEDDFSGTVVASDDSVIKGIVDKVLDDAY